MVNKNIDIHKLIIKARQFGSSSVSALITHVEKSQQSLSLSYQGCTLQMEMTFTISTKYNEFAIISCSKVTIQSLAYMRKRASMV